MSDDAAAISESSDKGGSSGYTPPATQDELNRIIADRLARERAKFADYDDLKSAASRLAEIEEASKTEAQRMADRLAKAEGRVAAFEQAQQIAKWRDEVAAATGVPAQALKGATKEELEEHASTLKSLITPPQTETRTGLVGPYVPSEGTASTNSPLSNDPLEAAIRQKLGI